MNEVTASGQVPQVESRGGDKPAWDKAVAGEPLPQRGEAYPEPDSEQAPLQDGQPLWPEDNWAIAQAGLATATAEPPGANDPETE